MRQPIDPARTYNIMTDVAARRRLATEFDLSRSDTADMTLDQLHDALAERLPDGFGVYLLIMTERSFGKVTKFSEDLLKRYHGLPLEPGAGVSSMTNARSMMEQAGVDVPDDADRDGLEDVLSAMKGTRYMIISDDDFTAYGREMAGIVAKVPTGRAKD